MITARDKELEAYAFSTPGQPTTEEQYAAFYESWKSRIAETIISFGFTEDEVDDILHTVMLEIVEHNLISRYDPTKGKISTYVYTIVRHLCMNIRKVRERKAKEVDLNIADRYKAVNDPAENDYDAPMSEHVRLVLAGAPSKGSIKLSLLFNLIQAQIQLTGKINNTALGKQLDVSGRLVGVRMKDLRQALVDLGLVAFDSKGRARWVS